jgi:hypothetical protein
MATDKNSRQPPKRNESTTSQAGGLPKIVWDQTGIKSAYADVFNVTGGREEIALHFGRKGVPDAGRNEMPVRLTNRILMSPSAAKRFAFMLNSGIREYEDRYGPLEGSSPPSTAREQITLLLQNPPFSKSDGIAQKADLLLQRIRDLDIEVGYERSFKMSDKNLSGTRFILGIKIDTIRESARETIADMCRQLEMPANLLENFQEHLPEANVVGFGFDESARSSVCKVYLEFGGSFKEAIRNNPHRPAPFVLHRGFKWDLKDPSKRGTARYTCYSFLPMETLLERVSNILDPHAYARSFDIAKDMVGAAASRIPARDILYLELTEDNSPRRSFDINMYRADMQLKELFPILSRMCRHYSIPSEEFHTLYNPVKTEIFGHLAGGIDRDGKDFLTVYYGVEGYYIP